MTRREVGRPGGAPGASPSPGAELTATVTRLDPSGDAVGQIAGRALRVPGMIPGERGRVRVEHVGTVAVHARLLALLECSDDRVEPACRHHEAGPDGCQGCPWMPIAPERQRALKRELVTRALGHDPAELVASPVGTSGYRWSSKRVVGGRAGALRLGSFRRRSHRVAPMDDCVVDHPLVAAAARELALVGSRLGIEPYDERRRRGDLRYVWLRTDGRARVLVTLVSARERSRARELAAALTRPAGVAWCVEPGRGNRMRGGEPEVLRGEARLAIELGGVEVEVGPLGFLQPNPACAALAYAALTEAEPGALAFDLYAGAGITTALLRRRFARVLCCEAYPESARALAVAPLTAARFLSDALAAGGERPGLVVANPPRAGLGEEVCTLLCELARRPGPGRLGLHLMSCEPRSLGRDLGRLTGPAGGFELGSVAAFDTLPHTPHVELVALLTAR